MSGACPISHSPSWGGRGWATATSDPQTSVRVLERELE